MKRTPKKKKRPSKFPKPAIWKMEKADAEFSLWIRERDNHTCQRCGKHFEKIDFEKRRPGLTNSHFWARQHKGTRYDPKNCLAVCWMPCHKYVWEKEKQGEYRDFMLRWLGEEEYAALEKRARTPHPLRDAITECMQLLAKK